MEKFKNFVEVENLIAAYEDHLRKIQRRGIKSIEKFDDSIPDNKYYDFIYDKINKLKNDKIFYHGSDNDFVNFEFDFLNTGRKVYQEGPGFYLSSSFDDAKRYGKYIHKFLVNLNRVVLTFGKVSKSEIKKMIVKAPDLMDSLSNWDENPQIALKNAIDQISVQNPDEAFQSVWADFYYGNEIEYLKNMINLKYDGILKNATKNIVHLIVFNPKCLKKID